jgi:Abortive infection C-terminus
VAQELGVAPVGHISRLHKQFFGATHTIVQSIGELRNRVGDAHGKGHQAIGPSKAQTELAVNLAGAVASFLLSTLESHLAATRRLTASGAAVLKFDKTTVWRLVDHAQNAPSHLKSGGRKKARAALWLVGDVGVYLMSNGDPPLLHEGRLAKAGDIQVFLA